MEVMNVASSNKLLITGASHEIFSLIKKLIPAEASGKLSTISAHRKAGDETTDVVMVFLLGR